MTLEKTTKQERLQKMYSDNELRITNLEVQAVYLERELNKVKSRSMVDPKFPRQVIGQIEEASKRVADNLAELKEHQFIIAEMFVDNE